MAKQKMNTLSVNTKEWNKMKKRLSKDISVDARVGFFSESRYGPENDNLPVATVAMWQEEGTMNIPPRPFMRYTIEALKKVDKDYQLLIGSQFRQFLDGKTTMSGFIGKLGEHTKDKMKDFITVWNSPPNAPYTIAKKGFNNPLIETGFMRDSVKWKLGRKVRK